MQSILLLFMALAGVPAERAPMARVAVGAIYAESNSLYPRLVPLTGSDKPPERIQWLQVASRSNTVASGVVEAAASLGLDIYPVHAATASSLGSITRDSFEAHVGRLVADLKDASPPFQGVILALHGAMVAEGFPHADAELVRRVRVAMGKKFPIVVTQDFHANVAPEIVENSDVLITFKDNPHVDTKARGVQAATIISKMLAGKIHPVQVLVKPPMLLNIVYQDTFHGPMKAIVQESRRLEQENPKILAVSVPAGYQYADVPQMGPSVIVATDGDLELARREAQRLSDSLWALRESLVLRAPDAATAVRQAMQNDKFPVVLMDTGDNIGGGSAGDGTAILDQLIRQNATGWVMTISDAQANEAAFKAGVGGAFDMLVGARTDKMHGVPVRVRGRVKALTDGNFIETEVRHAGRRYFQMGLTAVIEAAGSTADLPNILLLTRTPSMPLSLHEIISNGVYPARQRILVAKGTTAPRAAYEPVAARIVEVNTPGATDVNPAHFTYRQVRRPMFGLGDK